MQLASLLQTKVLISIVCVLVAVILGCMAFVNHTNQETRERMDRWHQGMRNHHVVAPKDYQPH